MNKLNILFLLIACRFTLFAQAQTTKEAFIALPESLSVDLNTYSRMDLIDLYHAGLPASVQNSFGDTLTLEVLTPEYLRLHTGNGSLQLILLTLMNDSQLYCLIRTVCGPVCDSRIEFYSPSWSRLPSEMFITGAAFFFYRRKSAFPRPGYFADAMGV
jgi:hypothetical protein